jgi:lipid-binding SYLF domain-containing protein
MDSRLRYVAYIAFLSQLALSFGCGRSPRSAADRKDVDRERAVEELHDATAVLRDIAPAGEIPAGPRERARCLVVVPSMVSGGLVLGARHGRGVVTCRTAERWSGPAFVTVSGGSAGLQIGLESVDLVMLVISERGMAQLFRSSFQLGADTSVAAGPTGQSAQASTDVKMSAEILSYARSRGLFAGVELSGAVMKQDEAAVFALYGTKTDIHAVLTGQLSAPSEAAGFLDQVEAAFRDRSTAAR